MLSARDYDAELAEQYGWINRALPANALDDFVSSLAHARNPTDHCRFDRRRDMPVSESLSRSGIPASMMVGTLGIWGDRVFASKARPRSLPSLIFVIAGGSAVNAIGV